MTTYRPLSSALLALIVCGSCTIEQADRTLVTTPDPNLPAGGDADGDNNGDADADAGAGEMLDVDEWCPNVFQLWGENDPYWASFEQTGGDCLALPSTEWLMDAEPAGGACSIVSRRALSAGCGFVEEQECVFEGGGAEQWTLEVEQMEPDGPITGHYELLSTNAAGSCSGDYDVAFVPAEDPYLCNPFQDWDGEYYIVYREITGDCGEIEPRVITLDLDIVDTECTIEEESFDGEGCGYNLTQDCPAFRSVGRIEQELPGGVLMETNSIEQYDRCTSTYEIIYFPL